MYVMLQSPVRLPISAAQGAALRIPTVSAYKLNARYQIHADWNSSLNRLSSSYHIAENSHFSSHASFDLQHFGTFLAS